MYGWNTDQTKMDKILQILGFEGYATWDKVKNLGLPLTLGQNNPSLWLEIVNKIKAKIVLWGGHWLTKAGKVILINSIFSSIPIYQSSLILAPKAIMDHISKLIKEFLRSGGKGNQNRMHLVKWETVKKPVLEGGLQIKDLGMTNLAMGGKLLWQLFSNKKHPVSHLFLKKYLHGGTLRNIQIANTPKGSTIWILCRKGLEFFVQHLYRTPSNGRQTLLWDDKN